MVELLVGVSWPRSAKSSRSLYIRISPANHDDSIACDARRMSRPRLSAPPHLTTYISIIQFFQTRRDGLNESQSPAISVMLATQSLLRVEYNAGRRNVRKLKAREPQYLLMT
jgi:hypothetical protein